MENGAKVVLFSSREETVEKALASLKEENADWEVSGDYPNLKDAKAVEAAIEKVKEKYGKLDILVNNAGISDSRKISDYTVCPKSSTGAFRGTLWRKYPVPNYQFTTSIH